MRLTANKALSTLAALTLLVNSTFAQENKCGCECPPWCNDKNEKCCFGEIECTDLEYASCECRDGQTCKGRCNPQPKEPKELAASVLSEVTNERVTVDRLVEGRAKFVPLLDALFINKLKTGTFWVEYEQRKRSFGFSRPTVRLLNGVRRELGGRRLRAENSSLESDTSAEIPPNFADPFRLPAIGSLQSYSELERYRQGLEGFRTNLEGLRQGGKLSRNDYDQGLLLYTQAFLRYRLAINELRDRLRR